jgi:hypothetical protein
MNPMVSVIIPVYSEAKYLGTAYGNAAVRFGPAPGDVGQRGFSAPGARDMSADVGGLVL